MKVKAIKNFNDLEARTYRNIGDEFEVSEERATFLANHNAVEIIKQPISDEPIKEEKEIIKKPKKTTKK